MMRHCVWSFAACLGMHFRRCHSRSRSFFFFQAEDGIRDVAVTGVQTCALPISLKLSTSYHPVLGHFLDSFSVQIWLFLFRSSHAIPCNLPACLLGATEHFGTLPKTLKQANTIICNQQVVGSNPTAGSSLHLGLRLGSQLTRRRFRRRAGSYPSIEK